MRLDCTLRINRSGGFTVFDESDHAHQCGSVGRREYTYFVSIEAGNRALTKEGYVMDNAIVDNYFQERYHRKRMPCDPCEAMATRAVKDLRDRFRQANPDGDLRRIVVRIHGSEQSFIECEWPSNV